MWCFYYFDLEMCCAPQRRALFDISTSKSGLSMVCFVHFDGNVLRATTACIFSTSQLPKVVRSWCVLYIFGLGTCFAPQRRALFRHLNFQEWSEREMFLPFLLTHVLRATTACNFSSLTWRAGSALARSFFDLRSPKSLEKTERIATFLPLRTCLLSSDFLHLLSSHFFTSPS